MPAGVLGLDDTILMLGGEALDLRHIMHSIGRIAFPIFAFLITEGFEHTRDRKRYGLNLLLFAVISEIPWNLVHCSGLFFHKQNVFFTLFLGYLGLCAIEYFKDNKRYMGGSILLLFLVALILKADYQILGFGFIIFIYLMKHQKALMAILGCCLLPSRIVGGMAFIPILMYNGERGFAKAKWTKYAFYIFYPLHLLVIFLIRTYIL